MGQRTIATFTSKGHDLFATVHGRLSLDNDRAVIDRLWNCYVAAWYERGKDDPKLALLRSKQSTPRYGWTHRAWGRALGCCSAPTQSRITKTRLPRSA